MAITKTILKVAGSLSGCATKLYNFLNENAVPEYFDSIEISGTVVSCKKGDNTILQFSYPSSYNTIKFVGAMTTTFKCTSDEVIGVAYKCKNGIMFDYYSSSASTYNSPIIITKDNAGNTVLGIISKDAAGTNIQCTKNSANVLFVLNENSDLLALNQVYFNDNAKSRANYQTAIVPLPVCGSSKGNFYTPNAFLMPFTQVVETGKIDINGTKYLTNGLWCIKDE